MFSWFLKRPHPPEPPAENPGRGHTVRAAFRNARKSWEETDDLSTSLAATLESLGHSALAKGDWVELEGGFALVPQVVKVEPLDIAGVNTVTTLQISHATLAPRGVFDYQHASGDDLRKSFASGFREWAEYDLPVFLDALRTPAKTCMVLAMPENRRVVLGPPVHMAQKNHSIPGEHGFCPCCLFTKNVDAFGELLRDGSFHGIRLYVSRDADGRIEAECRVNGVDEPEGVAALQRYARTWPDRGAEYRKQYVCIQTGAPAG